MNLDSQANVTDELQPVDESSSTIALVGLGAVAVAGLAGCSSAGVNPEDNSSGDNPQPPPPPPPPAVPNTLTSLTLRESSGGPVTVNGIVGGSVGVRFNLDGGTSVTSKPADLGAQSPAQSYTFVASGAGGGSSIGITINPTPNDVATALHNSLVATRGAVAAIAMPPSWDELMSYAGLTHAQIVERMLARLSGVPAEPYPTWIDEQILSYTQLQALTPAERDVISARIGPRMVELKSWFLRQLVLSPDPLSERLLLFWHNLFTSSVSDLFEPRLIARQHKLFREQLGGNLRTFLKAMARDTAMVEYLDSRLNTKNKPNENFARELLELFTLGERTTFNGYAESDIPLVAICFTGYGEDANRVFLFNPSAHDFKTPVTLWGAARPATADDGDWVIDRILAKNDSGGHSYCAIYIVTRLWKEFIGDPAASQAAIVALADQFSGAFAWDLPKLYRALFNRPEFSMATVNGTRIRAPIELFAGYFRALSIPTVTWKDIVSRAAVLDQNLFDPPNVFGWPGGTNWITVRTLADRREYMRFTGSQYGAQVPEKLINVLDILLLAIDPIGVPPQGTTAAARSLEYLTDPAYNLR